MDGRKNGHGPVKDHFIYLQVGKIILYQTDLTGPTDRREGHIIYSTMDDDRNVAAIRSIIYRWQH